MLGITSRAIWSTVYGWAKAVMWGVRVVKGVVVGGLWMLTGEGGDGKDQF